MDGTIIVVDDGSGEEYQTIFDHVRDVCIILRHPENRGKGAAIKTALTYVKEELWNNELIGVMDSDGQHLPEDMMKLLGFARVTQKNNGAGCEKCGNGHASKIKTGKSDHKVGI